MNYFLVSVISAFSILLPAGAALIRLPGLHRRYLPLAILLFVGLINECISYSMILSRRNNMVNSNIYTLIEFPLFLWLFYRLTNGNKYKFLIAGVIGVLVWVIDNMVVNTVWNDNILFRILSSFAIVWLSMDKLNQVLFNGFRELYKKTDLLLCFSFFVYYTYRTFIHIFNLFPMGVSREFYTRLWLLLSIINMITNVVYTIAILWIPKRQQYILRS